MNPPKGHIAPHGDGKWRVWYDIGPDPVSGVRRRRTKVIHGSQVDAHAYLERVAAELDTGSFVDPVRSRTTVTDFVDRYLAARVDLMASTLAGYRSKLVTHVVPRIGRRRISTVSGDVLSAMYRQLIDDGVGNHTIKHVHTVTHTMFKHAVEWKYIVENPAVTAIVPSYKKREMSTWTADEVREFLAVLDDHPWRAGFVLSAATGMRRGEVCGLRWSDVDFDDLQLRIRHTRLEVDGRVVESEPKSEKGRRVVVLDRATSAVLRAERTRQMHERLRLGPLWTDSGLVLVTADGTGIRPGRFTKALNQIIRQTGLPKIVLHELRHTWGTLAVAAGADPKTVSEALGHASVQFTLDTYAHRVEAKHREVQQAVANQIGLV